MTQSLCRRWGTKSHQQIESFSFWLNSLHDNTAVSEGDPAPAALFLQPTSSSAPFLVHKMQRHLKSFGLCRSAPPGGATCLWSVDRKSARSIWRYFTARGRYFTNRERLSITNKMFQIVLLFKKVNLTMFIYFTVVFPFFSFFSLSFFSEMPGESTFNHPGTVIKANKGLNLEFSLSWYSNNWCPSALLVSLPSNIWIYSQTTGVIRLTL